MWVGRSLERFEDEALLRGEGRFIDDLEPVPHAWHAAIVRSQLAHANIAVDPSAALAVDGVLGVLTGDDVARLSKPFPAAIDSPIPHYAAAAATARYVGEPLAVVVARDRYLAEDAAELVAVDYEPLEPVLDPLGATAIHDRSFHYGDVDDALARADLVVRETFRVPRFTCMPVECFGVVCDWDEGAGRLTAWANFQGPFTLHGVAAAALGLRGDRFRLLTPPDSGGSFGVKAAVLPYVVLVGLASRALGVPVRWTEDRLEHLAASSAATGRATTIEAGFMQDGELVALRYDATEDVGAYVRAPEPATLYRMHGSLSGAYARAERGCPVPGRAHEHRSRPASTAGSGDRSSTSGWSARWRSQRVGSVSIPRSSPGATSCPPTRCRTGRRPVRCTTPATTRPASTGRSTSRATTSCVTGSPPRAPRDGSRGSGLPASWSRRSRTWATSRSPRRRSSEPGRRRSRGTPKGRRSPSTRSAGSRCGSGRPRRDRGIGRSVRRWSRTSSVARPRTSRCSPSSTRRRRPGRSRPGNYSSRFSGVGVGAVQLAARRIRAKVDAIRAHVGEHGALAAQGGGDGALEPREPSRGHGSGARRGRVLGGAEPRPSGRRGSRRVVRRARAPSSTSARSRSIAETGAVSVTDYVTVHDAGVLLNPRLADGQILGGLAHGAGAALFERHVYDESGNLLTGSLVDYLTPTAPDLPVPRIGHLSSPSPFTPLGAKGLGEGNTMSAPVAIANAVADALGRDDVELPLTPPRVWALIEPVDGREAAAVRVRPRRARSRRRSRRSQRAGRTRSRSQAARASFPR